MSKFDSIKFLQTLIACKSITPKDDGAIPLVAKTLEDLGFENSMHDIGEGDKCIKNLYARYDGNKAAKDIAQQDNSQKNKNFCFAGHTDVVPIGEESEWQFPSFSGAISEDTIFGRGVVDMKGAIACFVGAVADLIKEHPDVGIISFLITGDEEGIAKNGTVELLKLVPDKIDFCIVGEPTSELKVVDNIKIGRRGSVNFDLKIYGKQGHTAYPHLAHNPLEPLVDVLATLKNYEFNDASEYFQSTSLALTSIDVGNTATNVIPSYASAKFNVRTSNLMPSNKLIDVINDMIEEVLKNSAFTYKLSPRVSGESFLNDPQTLLKNSINAIKNIAGFEPQVTTLGGTSDARFIKDYCSEILEIGLMNATAHQIDEHAAINDLITLQKVYYDILHNTLIG